MGKYDEVFLFGATVAGLIIISEVIKYQKEQPDQRFSAIYPVSVGKECSESVT